MNQSEIDFFDALAPEWDAAEVRSTPERIRSILGKMGIESGMSVLDLGTGTGVLAPYLSEMVGESGKVVGLDMSEGMLGIARQKYGDLRNVEFLRLDFEEEQIPGLYDIALLYSVYPHLHSPEETMRWLFKMNLKPGGKIFIAFPSDENFINNIHGERHAESDLLPSPALLADRIRTWGFSAEVLASAPDEYIVCVTLP